MDDANDSQSVSNSNGGKAADAIPCTPKWGRTFEVRDVDWKRVMDEEALAKESRSAFTTPRRKSLPSYLCSLPRSRGRGASSVRERTGEPENERARTSTGEGSTDANASHNFSSPARKNMANHTGNAYAQSVTGALSKKESQHERKSEHRPGPDTERRDSGGSRKRKSSSRRSLSSLFRDDNPQTPLDEQDEGRDRGRKAKDEEGDGCSSLPLTAVDAVHEREVMSIGSQLSELGRNGDHYAKLLHQLLRKVQDGGYQGIIEVATAIDEFFEKGHQEYDPYKKSITDFMSPFSDEFIAKCSLQGRRIDNRHYRQLMEEAKLRLLNKIFLCLLEHTMEFMMNLIFYLPRYIEHWKLQRRKSFIVRYVESGPFTWFQRNKRPKLSEILLALEATLDIHLRKIGSLKKRHIQFQQTYSQTSLRDLINDTAELLKKQLNPATIVLQGKGDPLSSTPGLLGDSGNLADSTSLLCDMSLKEFAKFLRAYPVKLVRYNSSFEKALTGLHPPSRMRQKWLPLFIMGVGVYLAGRWVFQNRIMLKDLIQEATTSVKEFWQEHMVVPMNAIIAEIVFNRKPEIQDAKALEDTIESLRRMLRDFINDRYPKMKAEEKDRVLKDMDMSLVSREYEGELHRAITNLVTGDIIRMLLIQVQHIKKELMVAMGAIDDLMAANQLSMEMMATVPVFFGLYLMFLAVKHAGRATIRFGTGRWESNSQLVQAQLRHILRDIERLLNLSNAPGEKGISLGPRRKRVESPTRAVSRRRSLSMHNDLQAILSTSDEINAPLESFINNDAPYAPPQRLHSAGSTTPGQGNGGSGGSGSNSGWTVIGQNGPGGNGAAGRGLRDVGRLPSNDSSEFERDWVDMEKGLVMLGTRDFGYLLLLLHQFHLIFEDNRFVFDIDEQRRLEEDLDDLVRDGLLVSQQLATIDRMYRTHEFLAHHRHRNLWGR